MTNTERVTHPRHPESPEPQRQEVCECVSMCECVYVCMYVVTGAEGGAGGVSVQWGPFQLREMKRALWMVVVTAAQQSDRASCRRTVHLRTAKVTPSLFRAFYHNYVSSASHQKELARVLEASPAAPQRPPLFPEETEAPGGAWPIRGRAFSSRLRSSHAPPPPQRARCQRPVLCPPSGALPPRRALLWRGCWGTD